VFLRGQHYKGSGGLPIFNNITSNNWQRKVRLVRIYKFWASDMRTIKSSYIFFLITIDKPVIKNYLLNNNNVTIIMIM
jgi:hypothetical protein